MKLYLFLRSIIWTSVLAVVFAAASFISAFIAPDLVLGFGIPALTFAILSPRRTDY